MLIRICIYHLNKIIAVVSTPSTYCVIRKITPSDTEAWKSAYQYYPIVKSMAVDPTEQNVYTAIWNNPTSVVRIRASDGTFVDSQSYASLLGLTFSTKIHPLQDNSGYFLLTGKSATGNLNICKYIFSISTSAQCQEVTSIYLYAYGQLMLSSGTFYFVGYDSISYSLRFYKATFGNTFVDWGNKILCSTGTCYSTYSESIISSDSSKIYSFSTYGNTLTYMYFVTFSTINGNVIGSRYKSNNICGGIYGSTLNDANIVITASCSPFNQLIVYDTQTSVFIIKQFSSTLYQLTVDPNSGRIVIVAFVSLSAYMTKFMLSSLPAHPDFTTSTFLLNQLATGTENVIFESNIPLNGATTESVSTMTVYFNLVVAYTIAPSYTSDVYFGSNDESYTILENSSMNVTPNLPCSSSGTTVIIFSFGSYNGIPTPSWVSINSSNGELAINSPEVSADTDVYFYVNSKITGIVDFVQTAIKLTVKDCPVQNCLKCQSIGSSVCLQCNNGYTLNNGICSLNSNSQTSAISSDKSSDDTKVVNIVLQAVFGATAMIGIISTILSTSSMASFWSLVNQVQLFFLLLLTRAFIPKEVEATILGFKFTLNPFEYIPLENIQFYRSSFGDFNFNLSNSSLDLLEIKSDSALYNTYSFFNTLILIMLAHLCVFVLYKLLCYLYEDSSDSFCKKLIKWPITKLYIMLTFGYYIRGLLEINQYFLISSIYEIYNFNTTGLALISLIFSFFLLLLCCSLILATLYLVFSSYKIVESEHNKFEEFFVEIKESKRFRFYVAAQLMRRAAYVAILITLNCFSSKAVISTISVLQLCYLIYVCILRPYREVKGNIIDIMNEMTFFILLCSLIYLNTEKEWVYSLTTTYMWILASNSLGIFLIMLVVSIKTLITNCRKKCCDSTSNTDNTVRIVPKSLSKMVPYGVKEETKCKIVSEYKESSISYLKEESKINFNEIGVKFNIKKIKELD